LDNQLTRGITKDIEKYVEGLWQDNNAETDLEKMMIVTDVVSSAINNKLALNQVDCGLLLSDIVSILTYARNIVKYEHN